MASVSYKPRSYGIDYGKNPTQSPLKNMIDEYKTTNNFPLAVINNLPKIDLPKLGDGAQPVDYNSMVHGIYDPLKNTDLNAIRSAFDSAISGYKAQKPLQEQYKADSLNTVDSNYFNSLGGLNAAMEAGGQRGGENITGNIALQTIRGNGVNQANQNYTNNLAAIDEAIRQATADKASQEAQVGQKWDSQIAKAIQDAQQQGIDNAVTMAGMTGSYIDPTTGVKTPTLVLKTFDANQADAAFQKQLDTIGQYSRDYTAEINKRTSIDPNDPLIPYLAAARAQKVQAQTAAEQAAAQAADKEAYSNAFKRWTELGYVASEADAKILGVPVNTRTADYDIKKIQAAIAQQNANMSSRNANKPDTPKEPSQTETQNYWASSAITQLDPLSPEDRIVWLKKHKAEIVGNAGLPTFNSLLESYGIYSLE